MDSKFIKSRQCSLERSHSLLTEINPEFGSRPIPFSTNRFLKVYQSQKFTKIEQWRFLYSITLCLATSHQQQLPSPISTKEILAQTISLNPHTRLDFKHHGMNISDKLTIIRNLCGFLQPGLISSTIFCRKLEFPTANLIDI